MSPLFAVTLKNDDPQFVDFRVKRPVLWLFFGILFLLFSCSASAKPLYVLGEAIFGIESHIKTYNAFENGTIEYVRDDVIDIRCKGPVDLALTPDGDYMFMVSGGSAWIQVLDTAAMTIPEEALVSGTKEDFSAVAFDRKRNLVYSVDKGQDQLYVHNWNRASVSLTLAENGRITLPGTTTFDLALDLDNDLLYVSNGTQEVHVFNLSDWSLNKIITLGRNVERIDLDVRNRVLYAGTQVSGDPYLLQYDLLTTAESALKIEDDASIVGIAVDRASAFVYVATLHPFYVEAPNTVQVFGGGLQLIDQAQVNERIAGLGVPVEGISYSPLTVDKRITGGTELIDGVHYIKVGNIITYEISLAAATPGGAVPLPSGSIMDNLPPELDYVSSSSSNGVTGVYDQNLHAVTWLYPSTVLTEPFTVELRARVQLDVPPGIVTNEAVVLSGGTPPIVALVDAFVRELSSPDTRAELKVYASELVGGKYTDQLVGVLVLPPHINLNNIDRNVPLILDPGGTAASFQIVYGRDGKVVVDAFFEKANLLAIIREQGMTSVSLTVTGGLADGSRFFGETTIPVTSNLRLQE